MNAPLADRLRPQQFSDVIGQEHLVGPDGPLGRAVAAGELPSMILWGPPGCGKTTIAEILGRSIQAEFHALSAVLSGLADLRKLIASIEDNANSLFASQHVLFVDEIHRWNKAQQDALLPYVEHGTVTLIGATTENPSFEVIGPLLSRCKVYCLEALAETQLAHIAQATLQSLEHTAHDDALAMAVNTSDGDARRLINTLEIATTQAQRDDRCLQLNDIERAVQKKALLYDKKGEEHYNIISAFIKSMRGSDPDAAVYYLARMYEAGEDPRFIARRMVIFASEDVSNADPQAMQVAVSAAQAYDFVGQAEGWIPLAQAATYLATAPKSNASYTAYKQAKTAVGEYGQLPVPMHLRNAPTKLMKNLGYGEDYKYGHWEDDSAQTYLPEKLVGKQFYKLRR